MWFDIYLSVFCRKVLHSSSKPEGWLSLSMSIAKTRWLDLWK